MAEIILDQKERVGAWVAQKVGQTCSWGSFYAMGVEQNGEIVAGIVMNNFNEVNATCHIAVDKPSKAMIKLFEEFCNYAFNFCKLKRITGMVPSNEPKVLAFDKHLGFEEEFVMKDGAPGADMHFLVMRPETCRWLRKE